MLYSDPFRVLVSKLGHVGESVIQFTGLLFLAIAIIPYCPHNLTCFQKTLLILIDKSFVRSEHDYPNYSHTTVRT